MSILSTTVLIPIQAGHFNSIGTEGSGKYAKAAVKKFDVKGNKLSFISPQAVRRYIRNYIELVTEQANYYDRIRRKTTKNDFVTIDPVKFFEDDFLGYSQPLYENPNVTAIDNRPKTSSMNRRSPFLTNGLIGVKGLVNINNSEGWVHPMIGTPLPYKAEFSSGYFQGSMNLEIDRIGIYSNYGDIIEMDPLLYSKLRKNDLKVTSEKSKTIFMLKDREERLILAVKVYYDSLNNLYGGGKSTMFGEGLNPTVLISSYLSSANIIPGNLFHQNESGNIDIDYELLETYLVNWKEKFRSPLVIGYRDGSLNKQEQHHLRDLNNTKLGGVDIIVTTPGKIKNEILERFK